MSSRLTLPGWPGSRPSARVGPVRDPLHFPSVVLDRTTRGRQELVRRALRLRGHVHPDTSRRRRTCRRLGSAGSGAPLVCRCRSYVVGGADLVHLARFKFNTNTPEQLLYSSQRLAKLHRAYSILLIIAHLCHNTGNSSSPRVLRWAIKEAARKAWGADTLGYRDIQVRVQTCKVGDTSTKPVTVYASPFLDSTDSLQSICEASLVIATPLSEELKQALRKSAVEKMSDVTVCDIVGSTVEQGVKFVFVFLLVNFGPVSRVRLGSDCVFC
ncbi:hypothetical protein MRB53_040126 [Persea americana]|nr:hypothetical protein MRB53_040126 [Persea americana]